MPRIGQREAWLIAGALATALPALFMWGFTVDDALISVRYAHHVATGVGWKFNAGGASTDGVTPLPWPVVLAPMAGAEAVVVLTRAKVLGLVAWIAAGGALGRAMGTLDRAPAWSRAAVLATMSLSVPLAAHAVSGMETALATSLATFAVLLARRPLAAAALAGLAAALRPEMAPWACVLAAGLSIVARRRVGAVVAASLLALAPFVACALVRVAVWGHPAPLAVMAKPSDLSHGLNYAGAAFVVTLVPVLVVAPLALRRAPLAAAVVLAAAAHGLALIAVGGDWMPYARLMVPVVPSLAWAAAVAAENAHRAATAVRSGIAIALGVFLVARGGTDGRHVGADRAALVEAARPVLAGSRHVASLDVGWVGAATDEDVINLAGVTDPDIASLPGGHTSKRVGARLLLDRQVDAVLLLLPEGLPQNDLQRWREGIYRGEVERRLAADEVLARHFIATDWLPLNARGAGYVLLRAHSVE